MHRVVHVCSNHVCSNLVCSNRLCMHAPALLPSRRQHRLRRCRHHRRPTKRWITGAGMEQPQRRSAHARQPVDCRHEPRGGCRRYEMGGAPQCPETRADLDELSVLVHTAVFKNLWFTQM